MFNKLKTWYNGLNKERVAFIIFWTVVALAFCAFIAFSAMHQKEAPKEEEPFVYEDTVFAVAVHDGQTINAHYQYKEIVFSNDHYLFQKEESGAIRHRDFNHPVYVESGDVCVVRVEVKGDQETVTLLRNLTKETLSEMNSYREDGCESGWEDSCESAWEDRD